MEENVILDDAFEADFLEIGEGGERGKHSLQVRLFAVDVAQIKHLYSGEIIRKTYSMSEEMMILMVKEED